MSKTHLISDPSLGVIQREYTEVDRKAVVGDYVLVFNTDICVVRDSTEYSQTLYKLNRPCGKELMTWFEAEDLRTLEPTDIIIVGSTRFRIVERKADINERVVLLDGQHNGKVGEVVFDYKDGGVSVNVATIEEYYPYAGLSEYRVLEPVQSVVEKDGEYALYDHETDTYKHAIFSDDLPTVDTAQASEEVIAMLANLAQRIVALENELAVQSESIEALKSRESVNTLARDLAEFIAKEARKNGR